MKDANDNAKALLQPWYSSGKLFVWAQVTVLAIITVLLYYNVLAKLGHDWLNDPNFSHGFIVPAFSAFVVWRDRKTWQALPPSPSWWGLAILVGALGILVVGVLGAELFLSRASLVFLLFGLVIYFLGWRPFRKLLFPWAVLFLMIPIPALIFNEITFPLQLLASNVAGSMLDLLGVPVLQEGNLLQLPRMSLELVQACSGIRSLMSLVTLSLIYGYFLEPQLARRVLLVVASVPVAIAANGFRVVGTGLLVYYWNPEKAEGFFHAFEGWLIFVLSLGLLLLVHGFLNLMWRWRFERKL